MCKLFVPILPLDILSPIAGMWPTSVVTPLIWNNEQFEQNHGNLQLLFFLLDSGR